MPASRVDVWFAAVIALGVLACAAALSTAEGATERAQVFTTNAERIYRI